jgi:hypothetical protein
MGVEGGVERERVRGVYRGSLRSTPGREAAGITIGSSNHGILHYYGTSAQTAYE